MIPAFLLQLTGNGGSGKTYVLQILEEELKNDYIIFHYNAWERDFYQEPLIAILSVIIDRMKAGNIKIDGEKFRAKDYLTAFSNAANSIIKNKIGFNIAEIISNFYKFGRRVNKTKLSAKDFDSLLPLTEIIYKIQEKLGELSNKKPILLIVDELDRCIPEYAIKVLERLHHITADLPIILITAIDKSKLSAGIIKVFSGNASISNSDKEFSEQYLRKFIDLTVPLSCGKINDNDDFLNGIDKEFKEWLYDDNLILDRSFLHNFIFQIMNNIDRRTQEKIFEQTVLCHKIAKEMIPDFSEYHYGILTYEIIACINQFYLNNSIPLQTTKTKNGINLKLEMQTTITRNIITYFDTENCITDTGLFVPNNSKSYIIAYFIDTKKIARDPFNPSIYENLKEDKNFIQKFNKVLESMRFG